MRMRLFKKLFVIVSTLTLSSVVMANTTKPTDGSVLPVGSRIVAGDLSKNEFYILAENDTSQVKQVSNQPLRQPNNEKMLPELKTALNQTMSSSTTKQTASSLKTAASGVHEVGNKKTTSPISTALNNRTFNVSTQHKTVLTHKTLRHADKFSKGLNKVANKKNISKIKVTYYRTTHKVTKMKMTPHSIAALDKSTHQTTSKKLILKNKMVLKRIQHKDEKLSIAKI